MMKDTIELQKWRLIDSKTAVVYRQKYSEYTIETLRKLCEEYKTKYWNVVMRAILEWVCDNIDDDNEIRERMVAAASRPPEKTGIKKTMKSLSITPDLNERIKNMQKKYYMFNMTAIVETSVAVFWDKYSAGEIKHE